MREPASDEAVTSLHDLSALDLIAGFRARQFSPSEVLEDVIAHIAVWEPHIKALYAFDPDGARATAKASTERWHKDEPTGLLDGVPVTIKDNIATKGVPVPLGAATTRLVPSTVDAPPAARLREAGGVILSAFADVLPWEWIHNSARWTYDESRHCRMGYERLMAWGLDPTEIPLGTYIYESASNADPIEVPIHLLGMLYFFETKNIRHKPARAQLFHNYGDALSEHDMDFDWADETIHAGYGKHWLKELLAVRGQDPAAYDQIRERCERLVSDYVSTATAQELADIKRVAGALILKAQTRRSL
jgi:hypothetical protein